MHSNNKQPTTSTNLLSQLFHDETVTVMGYPFKQFVGTSALLAIALIGSLVFAEARFGFGGNRSEQVAEEVAPLADANLAPLTPASLAPAAGATTQRSRTTSGGAGSSSSSSSSVSVSGSHSVQYESRSTTSSDPSQNSQSSRLIVDGVEQPVPSGPVTVQKGQTKVQNNTSGSVTVVVESHNTSSSGQSGGGN